MSTNLRAFRLARRLLALPVVFCAGVAALSAQTTPTPAATPSSGAAQEGNMNLQVPAHLDLPAFSSSLSSSSSSSDVTAAPDQLMAANSADHFNFLNAQYGRRRYGRPRYRGGNTNEDGSEKYSFFVGAGLSAPARDGDSNYLTENYGFQVGGTRNFNKHTGLSLQFDYNKFGFTPSTITNQSYLYTGDTVNDYGIDGNSHIWSFTLDPTFTFYQSDTTGAYFIVGGGFYHKTANFFVQQAVTGYDPYYGYYGYVADETIQNYSSNSAGVNGGIGITYKFSRFSNERFYAEAKAVHTFNNYRPGVTAQTPLATLNAYSGYNYFPQNSRETTYVPINVGIRF